MRRALLAALLAGVAASLAAPAGAPAIVGGDPAPPGQWPWMAAVLKAGDGTAFESQFCGGTVIAPRRVLTAGHCVAGERARDLSVLVGRTRLTEPGGRVVPVKGVSVLRAFERNSAGMDAAILVLARDAGAPPLRLASAADRAAWADGTMAWTTGWGQIDARRSPGGNVYFADRLRQVEVPIVGDDGCERAYGGGSPPAGILYRPAWFVCSGFPQGARGTCYGDSGGPLVVADARGWLEVGITKGGDGCATRGYPDLYTRVDRVRAFALNSRPALQPESARRPRVEGRLAAGARLRCSRGRWRGSPARLRTRWVRLGSARGGALAVRQGRPVGEGATHRVSPADVRQGVTCIVTAANAGGEVQVSARPLRRARPRG